MFTIDAIVRPLSTADSEYSVCGNSVLVKAKVVKTFARNAKGNDMQIEILEHANPDQIGKKYKVNSQYFEEIDTDHIWIDAYKGTDANMCCQGKQYRMNVKHKYTGKIALGSKGYHVAVNLKDCFKTYDYNFSNRFFRVKALVRKTDYNHINPNNTTLVAKEIKFVEEITNDPATIAAKRASM